MLAVAVAQRAWRRSFDGKVSVELKAALAEATQDIASLQYLPVELA